MDVTWPLGPRLKAAREALGLSKRAAARRAGISEQLWRRLETGYYTVQGERIPLAGRDGANRGASAETVGAAATAVGLDVREALTLVGYPDSALDADPMGAAEAAFKKLYATFEEAWGPEVARAAMRNVYRRRNVASSASPDQTSRTPESGIS